MKTKSILLSEKKLLTEGEGQRGKWQLVKLVSEDGWEGTTFNGDNYREGQVYEVAYEEVPNKRGGVDNRIKDSKPKGSAPTSEALLVCREINSKVDEILKLLKG